jgi:hypothetical protein
MTRDDILRLAREAGGTLSSFDRWSMHTSDVVRFAKLVAAAERETCANRVEVFDKTFQTGGVIADALCDRGE